MKEKENNQIEVLETLRTQAERVLSRQWIKDKDRSLSAREVKELLHELEVYQVELEMQNDELRASQELLEKERMRFTGFFNMAPVGYFILDTSAVIQECNDTGLALLASTRSQLNGTRFVNFIIPEDSALFYGLIHRLQNTTSSQTCQLKMRAHTGHIFYAQIEAKYIQDEPLGPSYYYVAVIDVTEKRNSDIAQWNIKNQLQMALTASATGTWHIYLPTKQLNMDSFAANIMGLAEENGFEGPYEALFSLIHPDDLKIVTEAMQKAIRYGTDLSREFRIVQGNGQVRCIEIKGHIISERQNEAYFSGIIIDITDRKKQEKEAEELKNSEQQKLLKAIVEAEENERVRISAALHDGVCQTLYAVGVGLENASAASAASAANPVVKNAVKLLNHAVEEIRNISFTLSPSILTDFGLQVALKEVTRRLSTPALQLSVKFSGLSTRLQPATELFLFRIIQELINNIIKHSKASIGSVTVARKKDQLQIKVIDNGIGFYLKEKMPNSSGFYSIKNRLALYNGVLKIDSKKKAGTTITVKIAGIN